MAAILILDTLFYDVFLECQLISIRILLSTFISVRQHSFKINEEYHKKIGTGVLNQVLGEMIAINPVPTRKGRAVKINYVTQVGVAPPRFVFFSNDPDLIHFSYKRYIENKFREYFGFEGSPIDLIFNKKNERNF